MSIIRNSIIRSHKRATTMLRTYMDVNTRPSHSQMFNKNGRCVAPSPTKPVVQEYSEMFNKVFGGCAAVAVAVYMIVPKSTVEEETEPSSQRQ
jgi:hypothetical protein